MPKKRWQRIIWSLQTGDRLFSLADRQPWNWGRSVIWWRRRARWGHSSLRRPGRGFISLEITKNGPWHRSETSLLKSERCFPTFSLNVNSSIIAFLYLKCWWHYIAFLLFIFLDPYFTLIIFLSFFLATLIQVRSMKNILNRFWTLKTK